MFARLIGLLLALVLSGPVVIPGPPSGLDLTVVADPHAGLAHIDEVEGDPPTTHKLHNLARGDTLEFPGLGDDMNTLTVVAIDGDEVTLHFEEPLTDSMELFDVGANRFTLRRGETLWLDTPTVDAGVDYQFTVE